MKHRLIIAIAMPLLLTFAATSDAKEVNILFIGNSFTARHRLSRLVKEVIQEGQPELKIDVETLTYGGQDLFRHHQIYRSQLMLRLHSITKQEIEQEATSMNLLAETQEAPEFYRDYWSRSGLPQVPWNEMRSKIKRAAQRLDRITERIKNGQRVKWDYVVLQSTRAITNNVDTGYGEYAQKFAKLAQQQGTKVVLYITAPDAQNGAPVDGPVAKENTDMVMKTIRQLVNRIKPHAVVPVPLAINQIQENGTTLTFRYRNDFHPNQTTAFLTANLFYAAMYKRSTEGFKFNTVVETKLDTNGKDPDGGDPKVVFGDETKTLLQKAAYNAAMTFNQ